MNAETELNAIDLDAVRRFLAGDADDLPVPPPARPARNGRQAREPRNFVTVTHGIARARNRAAAREVGN